MVEAYILQGFTILCIVLVMAYLLIQNYKRQKIVSRVLIAILGSALFLALVIALEYSFQYSGNILATTFMTFLGYSVRPFVVFAFIYLARKKIGVIEYVLLGLLFVNILIYAAALFLNVEFLRTLTYYYTTPAEGTKLIFNRGPFNFSSHILSFLYLIYLMIVTVLMLKGKHRYDAISIFICLCFIVTAVIIEMTGISTGLLNVGICISCVFYYIFLLKEENRRDPLTHLFTRATMYSDVAQLEAQIRGVIAIDMNGLKRINDKEGHLAGDKALICIGKALEESVSNNMYVYRIGGDEFVIIAIGGKKEDGIEEITPKIKEAVEQSGYSISLGYAIRQDKTETFDMMMRAADEHMYQDKANFYKTHTEFNRRAR